MTEDWLFSPCIYSWLDLKILKRAFRSPLKFMFRKKLHHLISLQKGCFIWFSQLRGSFSSVNSQDWLSEKAPSFCFRGAQFLWAQETDTCWLTSWSFLLTFVKHCIIAKETRQVRVSAASFILLFSWVSETSYWIIYTCWKLLFSCPENMHNYKYLQGENANNWCFYVMWNLPVNPACFNRLWEPVGNSVLQKSFRYKACLN